MRPTLGLLVAPVGTALPWLGLHFHAGVPPCAGGEQAVPLYLGTDGVMR